MALVYARQKHALLRRARSEQVEQQKHLLSRKVFSSVILLFNRLKNCISGSILY